MKLAYMMLYRIACGLIFFRLHSFSRGGSFHLSSSSLITRATVQPLGNKMSQNIKIDGLTLCVFPRAVRMTIELTINDQNAGTKRQKVLPVHTRDGMHLHAVNCY